MTGPDAPRVPGRAGPVWGRWVGAFLARVVWSTEVHGRDRVPASGPVLFAANHTGFLDGPILVGVSPRPAHILVKQEMFVGPLKPVLHGSGQIPVDRGIGRSALTAAQGVLARGGAVGIFPEGNRGRGAATSARAGIAWLALHGNAPVVPVAILGTRRTGESVGHIPRPRRRLVVEFGEPLLIEQPAGTSGRAAMDAATETVRVALAELVAGAAERCRIALPED